MRIKHMQAWWVRIPIETARQHRSDFGQVRTFDAAILRIETDDGIVGWGEGKNAAGSAGTYGALVHMLNHEVAPLLIGRDPRDISPIWEMQYNGSRAETAAAAGHAMPQIARRGVPVAAISAVDIALWDIFGKSLGEPVWRLLGGRKLEAMPAYASGGWADAENIGEQLKSYIDQGGFKGVKMRVGAMDGPPHVSAARVRAAREALGPDVDIMVDAHGTYTVAGAKRFMQLVSDCNLAWFEEPVIADDKSGMAEVRAVGQHPDRHRRERSDALCLPRSRRHEVGRHLPARPGLLRRHQRGDAHRHHRQRLQFALRAASVGRRALLLRGAACLRRLARKLHRRVFARRKSDDPRSCRGDDRSKGRYDRDPRQAGVGIHDLGTLPGGPRAELTMKENNLLAELAAYLFSRSNSETNRTPSERELAEHFSVSRGQIRESLAILEAMRIVERRAKSGIYLTTRQASVEAMALFAKAGVPLDPIQIYETVELRKIHEIKAAELACSRATEENYERLREILKDSEERLASGQPLARQDRDFHLEIVRATQNSVFHKICSVYYVMGEDRLPVYFSDPERGRRSHAEHLQIFDALLRRDGNLAQALMSAHLQGAESYWKGLISGFDKEAPAAALEKA